jgi:hypothetical protein
MLLGNRNHRVKMLKESAQQEVRVGENTSGIQANVGLILTLLFALGVFSAIHQYLNTRFDFGTFYYAAHMILDGSRHALYDVDAQRIFQAHFHRPPDMRFRNPPFALLPMLGLAELPMAAAYVLWTVISLALLYAELKILEIETDLRFGNWPVLLSLLFVPVMGCLLHGQFSILVLAGFIFAYVQWRRGRRFLGGVFLSIATLKFQVVLGFVAVLLLKRKWRELAGFLSGCLVLLAVSIAMTGIQALWHYPAFVLHGDLPISELSHLANWRGFLSLVGLDHLWLVLPLSVITVGWAAWAWTDLDRGFAAAMLASMVVSYHFTPEDLTLTILPFYLCAKSRVLPATKMSVILSLDIVVPMGIAATSAPFALLLIPLVLALWWIGSQAAHKQIATGARNLPESL